VGSEILDSGATISCPHGATASVSPKATKVTLGGNAPLLIDDVFTISSCSFQVSGAPQPCLRIQWSAPATKVMVESSPVLLASSVGLCMGAAPQGKAQVSGYQTKVTAE
jgi:hypothetical protein